MPTIFIADDSEPILRVLRTFFARNSRFRIVGEAQNYVDTVSSVAELKPDVVLADVRMPGAISGAAGLSQVVAACGCPVIAMSFTTDAELQFLITNAGAVREARVLTRILRTELLRRLGFSLKRSSRELRGNCADCPRASLAPPEVNVS